MDTILNDIEDIIYFQDFSNIDDIEYINSFISFNKESSLDVDFEEKNIYFSSINNNPNGSEKIFNINDDYDDKENENAYENKNNDINYDKINFATVIEKFIKKKKGKKIKKYKCQIKIFNYFKNKNEKIFDYINASERKQRKMMKSLYEKKNRMFKILLKKKIEKRINLNIKKNNFDFLHLFFNKIHKNNIKIEKLPCSYLGRKRIKF